MQAALWLGWEGFHSTNKYRNYLRGPPSKSSPHDTRPRGEASCRIGHASDFDSSPVKIFGRIFCCAVLKAAQRREDSQTAMKILNPTLRTAWKRSGYLALAGGLAFAASAYAQSSSPSFSSSSYTEASYAAQEGNGQYDNQPYPNQNYNNQRTPRYTGHSWLDHWTF